MQVLRFLAKIGDFGGATFKGEVPECFTPFYSAPEAEAGLPVHPKSDVYSMGLLGALLLTGPEREGDFVQHGDVFWSVAFCASRCCQQRITKSLLVVI